MVMPLWDENPFTKPNKPWVTWGLIALNIIIFFVEASLGDEREAAIVSSYALTPVSLTHPNSLLGMLPTDATLVTYMFLHADIFHVLGNMIFLFVFGDDIEEALGSLRFIVFYLACGIAGGLVFTATAAQSAVPLIGASGAVSGVIIAYLMLRPCAKIRVLLLYIVVKLDAFWVIGSWAVLQLLQLAAQPDDDVAYWCHVGGFIAGGLLFPVMRRPGVELFECFEHQQEPYAPPPMPDTSNLPGAPREPTVR